MPYTVSHTRWDHDDVGVWVHRSSSHGKAYPDVCKQVLSVSTVSCTVRASKALPRILKRRVLSTPSSIQTRLGVIDITHNGPIIAMDNAGVLRVGSALGMAG